MAVKIDLSDVDVQTNEGVTVVNANNREAYIEAAKEEGIEKETLKTVEKFNKEYIDTSVAAGAAYAQKHMEENEKVNKVIINTPFTSAKAGKVEVISQRSVTHRNPGNGEEVTKSSVRVAVVDGSHKPTKSAIRELQDTMTASLLS